MIYSAINMENTTKQVDFEAPGDFQALEYIEKNLPPGKWSLFYIPQNNK